MSYLLAWIAASFLVAAGWALHAMLHPNKCDSCPHRGASEFSR